MLPWLIAGVLGFLLFTDTKKEAPPPGLPPGVPPGIPPVFVPPVFVPPVALPPGLPTGPPPPPPPGTLPMPPPGGLPAWPAVAPAWWPAGVPYPPVIEVGDEFGPPAGWPPGVQFPPVFPLPNLGGPPPPLPPPGGPVPSSFTQTVCDYYVVMDAATWYKITSAPNLGDPFVRNAYEQVLRAWFDRCLWSPGTYYLLRQCGSDLVLLSTCTS